MDTWVWIVIAAAAAVVLVALLALWVSSRRRRSHLQDRFGPEYDRTVADSKRRRDAERYLEMAGINDFSLYPDLDGLAALLRRRFRPHGDCAWPTGSPWGPASAGRCRRAHGRPHGGHDTDPKTSPRCLRSPRAPRL